MTRDAVAVFLLASPAPLPEDRTRNVSNFLVGVTALTKAVFQIPLGVTTVALSSGCSGEESDFYLVSGSEKSVRTGNISCEKMRSMIFPENNE